MTMSYTILCVDDEREILESVQYDLEPLSPHCDIELAESVDEAQAVIEQLQNEERTLALILCDHIMPERLGVDFLIDLNQDEEHRAVRKLLLTGQAGLEATIEAVNRADLHYYLAKPWDPQKLLEVVIEQLTNYVIDTEDDLLPFASFLNSSRIFQELHNREI